MYFIAYSRACHNTQLRSKNYFRLLCISNVHVNKMATVRKELSTTDVKEVNNSLYFSGLKQSELARRLLIPRSTTTFVVNRYRKRGSVENIPRIGKQTKLNGRAVVVC